MILSNWRYWLIAALASSGAGLFLAFLSALTIGTGVSGGGCGKQCLESSDHFMLLGKLFLGLAVLFSALSMILEWMQRLEGRIARTVAVTTFNSLVVLICGGVLVFLILADME
jgi:hypothetical protein